MRETDIRVAAMLDTFRRAPIVRNYSDPDLRAALGSSPPLEKMKMGHTKADQWCDEADRARDRKTERDAAQVLITELVGALESARELIDDLCLKFPDADDKFNGVWASYRNEFDELIAKAKVQP